MKYNVNRTSDWGATLITATETRVLKQQPPPFATVEAKDIQSALNVARFHYGVDVVVSEPCKILTETRP